MKNLILYLLELKNQGLISAYALGGATALIYYYEPFQTQDIYDEAVFNQIIGKFALADKLKGNIWKT